MVLMVQGQKEEKQKHIFRELVKQEEGTGKGMGSGHVSIAVTTVCARIVCSRGGIPSGGCLA